MIKMNEAKDEAVAKGDEIAALQIQLRKAEAEKNRADDKIEMLTADKEEAEAKVKDFQEQMVIHRDLKLGNLLLTENL